MAMSGVKCSDTCIDVYNALKLKKNCKGLIFQIVDKKTIEVEKETNEDWEDFIKSLPEKESRYAVYDYSYGDDGNERKALAFISWCPDVGNVREKMLYSSSQEVIKKKLEGVAVAIQANDLSDLTVSEVTDKCKRSKSAI